MIVVRSPAEVKSLDVACCCSQSFSFDGDGNPHPKLNKALGILISGKPAIAEFMGIGTETLKKWCVKYPDLPIRHHGRGHNCSALSCNLLWWYSRKLLTEYENKKNKRDFYRQELDRYSNLLSLLNKTSI